MANILSRTKRILIEYINPSFCRPKSARIIVTANCQLRCKMCTFWYRRHIDPSLDLIKYWIGELADFGIRDVDLGGGEPLLRKDLVEIVNEVKSYGMTCGFTTNGWLVGKVPFPPVDRIEISIDGATPETHDKIRGVKGSWERAINAVKIAKKYCRVSQLNFVIQKDNYQEVADFCQLSKKLGVPVSFIPCSLKLAAQPPVSNELVQFDIHKLEESIRTALKFGNIANQEYLKFFLAKLKKGCNMQRCLAPFRIILIFTNGDVYPCGNFDIPVGNLSKGKSLKVIYQNYKPLRKEVWAGLHEFCNKCTYPDLFTRQRLRSAVLFAFKKRIRNYFLTIRI